MKYYSCGFLFATLGSVVLIRKNRPDWQLGLLNGVGGHVEPGETYHECMVREFKEETGVLIPQWRRFAKITSSNSEVVFFRAGVDHFQGIKTVTDEHIVFVDSFNVPSDTVPNLQWLIPMARINESCVVNVVCQ